MKPIDCLDATCLSSSRLCGCCINRSIIAKEGYNLIQVIEKISASAEQTAAVNAAEQFIKLAEDVVLKKGSAIERNAKVDRYDLATMGTINGDGFIVYMDLCEDGEWVRHKDVNSLGKRDDKAETKAKDEGYEAGYKKGYEDGGLEKEVLMKLNGGVTAPEPKVIMVGCSVDFKGPCPFYCEDATQGAACSLPASVLCKYRR